VLPNVDSLESPSLTFAGSRTKLRSPLLAKAPERLAAEPQGAPRLLAWPFLGGIAPAAVALAGCVSAAAAQSSALGVPTPVVHYSISQLNSLPIWTVGDPLLVIGAATGASDYEFARVSGAAMLSDGRIVVVDGGSYEIRLFDRDGRFLTRVGQRGQGPGEFMSISKLIVMPGDSLLVWDLSLRRSTVLSPDRRAVRVLPPGGGNLLVGMLADGSRLMSAEQSTAEFPRYDIVVRRVDPDGKVSHPGLSFPGNDRVAMGDGTYRISYGVVFAAQTSITTSGEFFYVLSGGLPRTERYDRDFQRRLIVSWETEDRRVRPTDVDAYFKWQTEILYRDEPEAARRLAWQRTALPVREEFPAVSRIMSLGDGNVWIKEYPKPWVSAEAKYLILSPLGGLIATARMPDDFALLWVRGDYALGLTRDAFDVERIELRPLRK
jgi:hypothetical protein